MIALLTARLFFAILVRALNCISKSARKTVFGHLTSLLNSATYDLWLGRLAMAAMDTLEQRRIMQSLITWASIGKPES